MSEQALVDVGGSNGGTIELAGANVNLTDGSTAIIQNEQENALGNLSIDASETITLSGTSPDGNISSSILTEALNTGAGVDLAIDTSKLVLKDGARLTASTYGDGKGGEVAINATESVDLLENIGANPSREGLIIS